MHNSSSDVAADKVKLFEKPLDLPFLAVDGLLVKGFQLPGKVNEAYLKQVKHCFNCCIVDSGLWSF